ncbi:MAG: outer membrane lipoprotein carrier protein LolA [Alphaproteobacteria bacterium]|jgi:outer membrane lipoprotein-sorting protein|nr:MAG: outer membrane lipoprotein carrier protein LolA [Alphaproteobacteria bacterium]
MFMKTGQKNLGGDLFSPGPKTRFTLMSILSALFPLALSVSPQALAAPAPVTPEPVSLPVVTAPAPKLVDVKYAPTAKPVAKPAPAVARQSDAELIKIQAPAAMDRNAIIDRVAKAMTDTKTVQGRFTQVDPAGAPSSGSFYINRPGKVRFEYTSPEPIFIVSDGTTVSIEEPKRKAYDAIPLASTPLHLFLRSNIDLRKDGSVTDVSTSNGSHFVTLVDKTGEAEGKMVLQFRTTDFELLGWRQIDGTGAETRVQLADMKKNVSLKPSLFVVRDPSDNGDSRR